MAEESKDETPSPVAEPGPLLEQRIDALLADAEAGGALSLAAARHAAALAIPNDPERYRRALALAARLDPLDATPRLALSRNLAESGDLDGSRAEAIKIFEEAVDQSARTQGAFVLGEIARALGDFAEARTRFAAAAAIARAVLNADPGDRSAARWHARAIGRLAELDAAEGNPTKARDGARGALAILHALAEQNGENPMLAADIADGELRMGAFELEAGDAPAAGAHLSEAVGRYELLVVHEPNEPHWRGVLADAWTLAAETALLRDAPGAARNAMDKALQLRVKLAARDPGERWALASAWRIRASQMAALADGAGIAEALNQARALAEQLCAENPGAPHAARFLVHILLEQADHAMRTGALELARAAAADAQRWAELFARAPDAEAAWRSDLAAAWDRLGDVARAVHAGPQAQDAYARAVALRRLAREAEPKASYTTRTLAASLLRAGECALEQSDAKAARAAFAESALLRISLVEPDPEARGPARELAVALERVGIAAAALGDSAGARKAWEDELVLAARIFPDEYDTEGLRFRAVVESHLAGLGGPNADAYRAAALKRFDTLAWETQLSPGEEALRQKLWKGGA